MRYDESATEALVVLSESVRGNNFWKVQYNSANKMYFNTVNLQYRMLRGT